MRDKLVHEDDIRVHPVVAGFLLFVVIFTMVAVNSAIPPSAPPSQTDREFMDAMVRLECVTSALEAEDRAGDSVVTPVLRRLQGDAQDFEGLPARLRDKRYRQMLLVPPVPGC